MDYFTALKIFHSVSESGNFSLTAKQLGLAVSSVTRQIDGLEQQLDIKLFQRTTRKIHLTYAGEQYLSKTRHILNDLQDANQSLKEELLSPRGKLRITFPICYGNSKIGPLLSQFSQLYPQIELELFASDLRVDLFSSQIDLAIRLGKVDDDRLIARLITKQERWLCVSPDYLKKHGEIEHPQALYQHNCLPFLYPDQYPKWHFYQSNKHEVVMIKGNLSGNSIEMIMQATIDGQGISLLPDWLAKPDIDSGRLIRICQHWQVETTPNSHNDIDGIYLVYPSNNRQVAKVKLLVDYLMKNLKP